ncbi:hypothetical protein KR018_010981 [Drosophila ironensis]|nr:hypothetical protein KR018_010981 [Drosophila ironensis]
MDLMHTTIGVATALALIVVVGRSMSEVGNRVAMRTSKPICLALTTGSPIGDQLTSVAGILPLVEGDGVDNVCGVINEYVEMAGGLVGPLIPSLACNEMGEEEDLDRENANENRTDADAVEPGAAPPEPAPVAADPEAADEE